MIGYNDNKFDYMIDNEEDFKEDYSKIVLKPIPPEDIKLYKLKRRLPTKKTKCFVIDSCIELTDMQINLQLKHFSDTLIKVPPKSAFKQNQNQL